MAALGIALAAVAGVAGTAAAQDAEQNRAMFSVVVNQVLNDGNLQLVDDLVASNVTNNGAPLGRAGFKRMVEQLRSASGPAKLQIEDVATDGDKVVGRVTETGGTTSGSRLIVLRIVDGQVGEYWSLEDNAALRKQFGLSSPAAGTTAGSQ
jgi:predicted ester cyclase